MIKKFLVAVDGSDQGWKAADLATDLAKASNAELLVLHVVPKEPLPGELEQFAEAEGIVIEEEAARYRFRLAFGDQITKKAKERVRKNGVDRVTSYAIEGDPAHEIVEMAKSKGADMIFLGSRGLGGMMGLLMGSVSHKVMHLALCTCVAVK